MQSTDGAWQAVAYVDASYEELVYARGDEGVDCAIGGAAWIGLVWPGDAGWRGGVWF